MARRRKRIPYDPPSKRKRGPSRFSHLRPDQIALTRRTMVMKGGIIAAFATMATKLGIMQLVQGDVYQKEARENVIHQVLLPAPRGLILDRQGRPLAQNRRAWELRVVPADLPKDTAERQRVLDTLISALQIENTLVVDPNSLPEASVDTVYSRIASMLGYTGEDATDMIRIWKDQSKTEYLINITPYGGLSIDDAARFRAAWAELPGVMVMNRLNYLIENIWNARLPVTVASDIPREVALKLEANRMYLPGVELDDSALVREYTGGEVMSHVVGYVQQIDPAMIDDPRWKGPNGERIYEQNDVIGRSGIELGLEQKLRGKRGHQSVERDATNVQLRVLPGTTQEPVPGENIHLTIDLEFQEAVGKALQEQIQAAAEGKKKDNEKRKGDGKIEWKIPQAGSVVAFDPRNGEILAMVSYPYYDNQLLSSGISQRKYNEYIDRDAGAAFLNRATSEVYPPGSTFKIFLAASALQHGTLDTNQTHVCRGAIRVPYTNNLNDGDNYACWVAWNSLTPHGELDVYGAIEQSCDVFFYNVAVEHQQPRDSFDPVFYWDYDLNSGQILSDEKHVFNGLGIEPIYEDMTTKFWFGKETGIEIGEEAGLVPGPEWKKEAIPGEQWTVGDTINISIGQGEFQVTPLQLAMNTGVLATKGTLRKPHLVMDTVDSKATPVAATPEVIQKLGIDGKHLEVIREGMRRVCHSEAGTAFRDANGSKWKRTNPEGEDEIIIAGKTGTAEFGLEDDIGAKDSHAWFTCFAPLDDPEIAVSVVIEAGGEGSTYSVPVADAVLRAWFELTGKRKRGTVLGKEPKPV
ncbi:MAG TPA: penicillin-binding transpeptidase domain-containing protein [Thermomicrobiales bacterium]|nr:penicillin-binding transpeptidase domain-containing protein [Thermomicrobiales bacterium]